MQKSMTDSEGNRKKPDVIVNIPGGGVVVIDSKVSTSSYIDLVRASTDEERKEARNKLNQSIRNHIKSLSNKEYQNLGNRTVRHVIMFIPIEGVLTEVCNDGSLLEFAAKMNITFAMPSTLMMGLRTISDFWLVERRDQNAEKIAEEAGKIYDKAAGFVKDMGVLGTRLDQAQKSYESAKSKLIDGRGNIVTGLEKLKEKGAKTSKHLTP